MNNTQTNNAFESLQQSFVPLQYSNILMFLEFQQNPTKFQSVNKLIISSIAKDPSKIIKSDLNLFMYTIAMDFGVPPPSSQQMDIIFALLDRNNNGWIGQKQMEILLDKLFNLIMLDQQHSISQHFERLISQLRIK